MNTQFHSVAQGVIVLAAALVLAALPVPAFAAVGPCNGLAVTIVGTMGDDVIVGTPGDDVIKALNGNDVITGGNGNDTICAGYGDDWVDAGLGDDWVNGGHGADTILGGDGSDSINGSAHNDNVDGGPGNDFLYGDWGNDLIHGGDGNDEIYGQGTNDALWGDVGDDTIDGGDGNDNMRGGLGNDSLVGGTGDDTANCGEGTMDFNLSGNEHKSDCENTGPKDGAHWVRIPAGTFSMGNGFGTEALPWEIPVHPVTLTTFEMYAYEVTNGEYAACVAARGCSEPLTSATYTRDWYFGNPAYANYPVMYVDWVQAQAFCAWVGGQLPTEAQWEYAARGGMAGKRFPWGDTIDCGMANYHTRDDVPYDVDPYVGLKYCVAPGDTTAVGSYPANGYGLFDMVGNISEWVRDLFRDTYYRYSPTYCPLGPTIGPQGTARGGGYSYWAEGGRVDTREAFSRGTQIWAIGFRCTR